MKNSRRTISAFTLVAVLISLVLAASFWALRQIETASVARDSINLARVRADELLSALDDGDSGVRGFVFTGDETLLAPYLALRRSIPGRLEELRRLAPELAPRTSLDALSPLLDAKFANLDETIRLRRVPDMPSVLARFRDGEGRQLTRSLTAVVGALTQFEKASLAQHEESFQRNIRILFGIIVLASVFSLLLSGFFVYLIFQQAQNRIDRKVHEETAHLLEIQENTNGELRLANETLQVSEEKLSVTLDSIGDGVIATDVYSRVTRLNPLAARLTGWTEAEARGRLVNEVFAILNQETRLPAVVPVAKTLSHGTIQGLANHTILVARSGSECAIADSCAPIRDREGNVVGAVLVFRDVTATYAAQQAIRDGAVLLQGVMDTVDDGIITLRASTGRIESVNRATSTLFGYAESELIGELFALLVPELGGKEHRSALNPYRASDEARAAGVGREVTGRRKDGSTFALEMLINEFTLGEERFFAGVLRDITIRQRIEAERNDAISLASSASRAKTDFLSGMSHELRTPLNAILGFAQLLESGETAPTPGQRRSIEHILKAGWYLLMLINEILDLSRIESGKVMLSHEAVALDEVMDESRTMVEAQALARAVLIELPMSGAHTHVLADRTRLKQVLINLLSNAIKYNRSGGKVSVRVDSAAEGAVRISVSDTGIGLNAAQMAQLFQPFNRLGRDAGKEEGTGIGLVVTKRLVELMGGAIGAESVVGSGSTFWVELQKTSAPQIEDQALDQLAQSRAPRLAGAPTHTLLYVEDNPANLDLVEQIIARRADLHLLSAADGNLGIELARSYLPEVILMDINLPGISGLDALRLLRADPLTVNIPVIAISANALPRDIERAIEAGFFQYLTKPIKVPQFMETLDAALEFSQTMSGKPWEKEQA